MADDAQDRELREKMRRLDALLKELEAHPDRRVSQRMREIVQTLMSFHGAAVGKLMEQIEPDQAGKLAKDEWVSSLLLLYGLHPLELGTRIGMALQKVRPRVYAQDGAVELIASAEDTVKLTFRGDAGLRGEIEEAILEWAPEIAAIEFVEDAAVRLRLPILART